MIDENEYSLFHLYQPSGVLPPLPGNGCQFFVETYGLFIFFFLALILFLQ